MLTIDEFLGYVKSQNFTISEKKLKIFKCLPKNYIHKMLLVF